MSSSQLAAQTASEDVDLQGGTARPVNPYSRRNFGLGVANGALATAGSNLIDPQLVLAAFVYQLTQSNLLVGVLVTLASVGIMWPQLYVSVLIEPHPRKKPFYIWVSVVRILSLTMTALAMGFAANAPISWVLAVFFLSQFVFQSAQGASWAPFMDMVGQTVPAARFGSYFAWRGLLGDGLGLLIGYFVIQTTLDRVPFPKSYALLTFIALGVFALAWTAFSFVEEPLNRKPPHRQRIRDTLHYGFHLVRTDTNYRGMLLIRLYFRVSTLALAFYIPYGVERLGVTGMAGTLVASLSASRLLSSIVWGRLSQTRGNRVVLIWGGVFFALSPALVLLAPYLPEVFRWSLPGVGVAVNLPLCVYLFALFCFGAAMRVDMISNSSFLLESAPPDRRPSYIAFLNTAAFPLTFLPAIVGALMGESGKGLEILFGVSVLSGCLTLATALRLKEVRKSETNGFDNIGKRAAI
jgi:MFS family permease